MPIEAPRGPQPYEEARLRDGLAQLLEGLSALHDAGKVHRDVKPSNVLVARGGAGLGDAPRVVLLDFGLVTEAGSGERSAAAVVGTPEYMAPEQAASRDVGPPADLYGVGVMLYEVLTGEMPFQGAAIKILMEKQAKEPPPVQSMVPAAPDNLAKLCDELLRFEPARRPTAAQALGAFTVSATRTPVPPPRTPSSSGPAFVGRADELRALREAFDAIGRGELQAGPRLRRVGHRQVRARPEVHDELGAETPSLVLLEGRCYEREAVPYKALDGIVDALARRLSRMPADEAAVLLPVRVAVLARMFPVMLHVPAVAKAHATLRVDVEPHDLRRRALLALRELFVRLTVRHPTIVVNTPGVSSGGPTLPVLFGRGSLMAQSGDSGQLSVASGITVRATAIASTSPARTVGRPNAAASVPGSLSAQIPPPPNTTNAQLYYVVFKLSQWNLSSAFTFIISTDGSGGIQSSDGKTTYGFVADGSAVDPTDRLADGSPRPLLGSAAIVGDQANQISADPIALTNELMHELSPTGIAYIPLVEDNPSNLLFGRVVGFGCVSGIQQAPNGITIVKVSSGTIAANVSATLGVTLPDWFADPSLGSTRTSQLFTAYSPVTNDLMLAPALVTRYVGPQQSNP